MNKMIEENEALNIEISKIAEVAGYLWQRGWAEYNGGNISVRVSEALSEEEIKTPAIGPRVELPAVMSHLCGEVFYVTGTGKRMRYVASSPWDNGSLIRISDDGSYYEIIYKNPIRPTSELPSHLSMHNYLRSIGRDSRVVLHTHPTDLIALTHSAHWLDSENITHMLWSMIPECRIIVPRGVGIVPYRVPGTMELAASTIEQLTTHDVVFWEKHGILATGADVVDCFDVIDTLSKSAQIYLTARTAGFVPEGMTCEQLDELVPAFHLEKYQM
ncbi:MAG: rhamnulose-1-phosphate aldolase [Flavobacteriales bacterium]|jgi:rhamnulose-1-phosphate aldolase|nr:rhamnulose-1-phosphate aldolase [Flavobacteriales bacterium]MBQ2421747.1 rhamnulose-1-phosphate aldolase [Flavobacteriales bacterium]MBQ5815698.1 rhamnulose-1-phosphate aldolase [Flavobacteriales bacterium]